MTVREWYVLNRRTPQPVKAELVLRGIQQKEAAAAVGVNPSTFCRIVNGYVAPWPALRRRLADYLDLDESKLFDGEMVG